MPSGALAAIPDNYLPRVRHQYEALPYPHRDPQDDAHAADWKDPGPDPARDHDGREAWSRLAQALRGLPARQREAFTLRVLEELDVEATAKIMGCSEGSVKTHLFRAREALQRQLEEFR